MEKDFWQAYRDKGLMMVWINLGEKPEKAKWFQEKHHLTSPVLMADETSDPRFKLHAYAIPYSVLVDRQMVIRNTGAYWWKGKDLERTVNEVMAEPARGKSAATTTSSIKPISF